jgi:hypothetical protein
MGVRASNQSVSGVAPPNKKGRFVKTLDLLCKPRASVFDTSKRDTVLDLTNLARGQIDAGEFFEENYVTDGMKTLLRLAFMRLEGRSSQGLFKLTQAMGGGKTHNLLVLGLLAKHPRYRTRLMEGIHKVDAGLGEVRVVAFSGRESDAKFGIWGEIADQLGKSQQFKEYYGPLKAPGQTAWQNLLKDECALILLDELPAYFQNARSIAIGNSDLAEVTETALSNLLVALNAPECQRVCVVLTDLRGAYQQGSEQIAAVLNDYEHETNRSATPIEPVQLNSDEFYHILRTRLFEKLPSDQEIADVAQGYKRALEDAHQMEITSESPAQAAAAVSSSYPFHPKIRDLYARFRENPGYQQTRALIRLMRIVVARLWANGLAKQRHLIAAHELDFNDPETLAELAQINSNLSNAIAHDIASRGAAVAERMDADGNKSDARDTCRLLLISSLANVPNAIVGLSVPEVIAYLCAPGRDLSRLKSDVIDKLAVEAWYLHSTRDGKLYFRNVENLVAKLESRVKMLEAEQAKRELRGQLEVMFAPRQGWCYQRIAPLPALDEVNLEQDKVTLLMVAPTGSPGLAAEVDTFYANATYKNRLGVLTGTRNTYEQLLDNGRRMRAMSDIITELEQDKVPENDPQMVQAREMLVRIQHNFGSAARETFTVLWYPRRDRLVQADFRMEFRGNDYNGEEQIRKLLADKGKFTDNTHGDEFREKCEERLFTTGTMKWSEIKLRASTNADWQWHDPRALDELKEDCLRKERWREDGGYIDKNPPPPTTDVTVREVSRNDDTGEVELRIETRNADEVYYEINSRPTKASKRVDTGKLVTAEMRLWFGAYDSTGEHATGPFREWTNRITIKHRLYQAGAEKRVELRAAPPAQIRYTTDGSDPRVQGGLYEGDITIPKGTVVVLASAAKNGVESEVTRIPIDWGRDESLKIDPARPATWKMKQSRLTTADSFELIERMKKYSVLASGVTLTLAQPAREWIELTMWDRKQVGGEALERAIEVMRELQSEGQVKLEATRLHFPDGQKLLDWVAEVKATINPSDVTQS